MQLGRVEGAVVGSAKPSGREEGLANPIARISVFGWGFLRAHAAGCVVVERWALVLVPWSRDYDCGHGGSLWMARRKVVFEGRVTGKVRLEQRMAG